MASLHSSREKDLIPLFRVNMPPAEVLMPALQDVLYSGFVAEGLQVQEFEREFGRWLGTGHFLGLSSGTAALHTALVLSGVGPGDEVISTALTAEPTNMAILQAGGRVVWADIDPANGNLSPASVRSCVTGATRAIVVVHYAGVPAALDELRQIARDAGVPLIEDAAHALGARYGGSLIGAHADYAVFSYQAIKHMTTIDGGGLACRSEADLERARAFRWFGMDRRVPRTEMNVRDIGYKYNMNNVTAQIGLVQLKYLDAIINMHVANGRYFDSKLKQVAGLRTLTWEVKAEPSYWLYTVLVDNVAGFIRHLGAHGIVASRVHQRNDRHQVFAASSRALPCLDVFYQNMVHIPCGWWVTPENRERMVDVIRLGW